MKFFKSTMTPILAISGATLGLIGTCLGILNYVLARRSHRYSVRVEVRHGSVFDGAHGSFDEAGQKSIELRIIVINNSYLPVQVASAGIYHKPHWWSRKDCFPIVMTNNDVIASRTQKELTAVFDRDFRERR